MLGARKVSVERPRGRYIDGGEVELDTWATFASEDLLRQVVVERMLAGVATRRHLEVAEPVGQAGTAVSKSAVLRRFVAATQAAVAELLEADLSGLETAVVMIDGLNIAGEMIVVALVITSDGTKVPVGLRLGDTENKVVVTDLLADLVARGLRFERDPRRVGWFEGVAVRGSPRCSAPRRWSSAAPCTSDATSPSTCRSPGARRSTSGSLGSSPTPTARRRRSAYERRLAAQLKRDHPDRGRFAARGSRGDVHRRPARRHRRPAALVDEHQLHRVDDLHRPCRHPSGEALARTVT